MKFEFLVEEGIIKTRAGRVAGIASKVDRVDPRPVDCGQAHGARLATGVHFAAFERESAQRLAGLANRVDLAVSRWIVGSGHAVRAFADVLSILYDHGGKGASGAGADVLRRQ